MPDYSADGHHYLPASKTPSRMNDKKREIDDFRPHVKKAKLESENYIQNSCDTFIVEKHLLLKHLNHLSYLKIKQEKREQKLIKKKNLRKEQNQNSFSEYDWEELIYSGKIMDSNS